MSEAVARYFDNLAPEWDKRHPLLNPLQPAVARIADISQGSRVLDLGCGTGIMAPVYLDCAVSKVVALDVSSGMIACAKEKYADIEQLEFLCCDILDYSPLNAPLFDAVVIYNAYPHFLCKQALVEKVASLLKPEGRFVVAHGMGRAQMNAHHANVPVEVTTELGSAIDEAAIWRELFTIDALVDTPSFYCFAGYLH